MHLIDLASLRKPFDEYSIVGALGVLSHVGIFNATPLLLDGDGRWFELTGNASRTVRWGMVNPVKGVVRSVDNLIFRMIIESNTSRDSIEFDIEP